MMGISIFIPWIAGFIHPVFPVLSACAWSKHLCFSNSWRRRSTATFASQLRMNLAPKAGTAGTWTRRSKKTTKKKIKTAAFFSYLFGKQSEFCEKNGEIWNWTIRCWDQWHSSFSQVVAGAWGSRLNCETALGNPKILINFEHRSRASFW